MGLRPYRVVSVPSAEVLNVCEAKNIPLVVQNEERVGKMRPFNQGPLLPSVYLHVIHMIKRTIPSTSLLKAIKNWMPVNNVLGDITAVDTVHYDSSLVKEVEFLRLITKKCK